jgi:hypothetical protein
MKTAYEFVKEETLDFTVYPTGTKIVKLLNERRPPVKPYPRGSY